jgi:hypothetical protein
MYSASKSLRPVVTTPMFDYITERLFLSIAILIPKIFSACTITQVACSATARCLLIYLNRCNLGPQRVVDKGARAQRLTRAPILSS